MKKHVLRGFLLLLLLQVFTGIYFVQQAEAATVNVNLSSWTYQAYRPDGSYLSPSYSMLTNGASLSAYSSGGTYYGVDGSSSVWQHHFMAYSLGLPTGIKVTSARLMMYCARNDNESASMTCCDPYLAGQLFNPINITAAWMSIDVTSWFSLYTGGSLSATQNFDFTLPYTHNPYSYHVGFSDSISITLYNGSYLPYLQITYDYVPSTPAISSPVAGSNNKTSVTLSASSTVTGGAQITYSWQYSLDANNWTAIFSTTSTSYNWTIPASIADNSSIYVRCYATASGVSSVYSASIRFNKADDPAIAAKLAAESAELAAESAKSSADNANLTAQKALSVVGKPCLEISSSTGATLTIRSTVVLNFMYSNEMGNLTGMTYCYRNRGGTWSSWTLISNLGYCSVSIPLSTGYNILEIKVKNADGVESKGVKYNIWCI